MSLHWQNSEATQSKVVGYFSEEHDYKLGFVSQQQLRIEPFDFLLEVS